MANRASLDHVSVQVVPIADSAPFAARVDQPVTHQRLQDVKRREARFGYLQRFTSVKRAGFRFRLHSDRGAIFVDCVRGNALTTTLFRECGYA
jgi:hypothetical protein